MPTVTASVAAGTDDGGWDVGGTGYSNTGTNFVIGDVSSSVYDKSIWLRMPSLAVPQGAVITAATITIQATGGNVTPFGTVKIQAEAADSPTAPTNRANAIARVPTTAAATWSGMTAITSGRYTTSDVSAVVQEIVNRAGWASGNTIQFLLTDNTAGWGGAAWQIAFASYNASAGNAAQVSVTYSTTTSASATAIASAEAFGTTVATLTLATAPTAVASSEAFGSPTVTATLASVATGITSAEGFGSPVATLTLAVTASGIASLEAFGSPTATPVSVAAPSSIASAEAFGTVTVTTSISVTATSVATAEAFGIPTLSSTLSVTVEAIDGAEAFGTAVALLSLQVTAEGIASDEAFGVPGIRLPWVDVTVTSVTPRFRTVTATGHPGSFGATPAGRTVTITERTP